MRETAPKFHQKDLRNERLFTRIAEQSDRLLLNGGRVEVVEPIETPYDEFGIVDKKELFRRILDRCRLIFTGVGRMWGHITSCGRGQITWAKNLAHDVKYR